MSTRPWFLAALVWLPFLSVFVFASQGDTSALHISSHVLALVLLVPATLLVFRAEAGRTRTQRVTLAVLRVSLPLAVVGHALELGTAVHRLAADGWVNRDTSDIWAEGPHVWAANVTVPAMLVSMVGVLVLVVSTTLARRRVEPA